MLHEVEPERLCHVSGLPFEYLEDNRKAVVVRSPALEQPRIRSTIQYSGTCR